MTTAQVLRQLRHIAALATDNNAVALFAAESVRVAKMRPEALYELAAPILILQPQGSEEFFRESPFVQRLRVGALIIVDNEADFYGDAGLLGTARADSNSPVGYGCIQIADFLQADGGAFRRMGAESGLPIVGFIQSAEGPQVVGDPNDRLLSAYEVTIEVIHANQPSYPKVRAFSAVDATGGDATLSWTLPPARFDNGGVMIRRAAGSTAPATPSDGTLVGNFGRGTTSTTDSPGAGQFSYSVWAIYDPDTQANPGTYPDSDDCDTQSTEKQTATVTVT